MSVSPFDRLRAMADGKAPIAAVTSSFGMVLDEVERGRVVARAAAPPRRLQGAGVALVIGDLALSCAISTMLGVGQQISTLSMHVVAVGPPPREGAPLIAEGRLTHLADDHAVSSAEIHDGDGVAVAVLRGRCAVFPARPGWGEAVPSNGRSADPFADLGHEDVAEGAVAAVASPTFANSGGAVQGGVLAAVAAHALDVAIGGARPRLASAPTELDVTFVRGVPADGAELSARAEVLHGGTRYAIARGELRDSGGRLAVLASASRWRG